jgi:hypothetical protein
MDADDRDRLDRVEQTHGPSITWGPDGAVGYLCACGGPWPCEVFRRADDARRHHDRVARDARRAGVVSVTSRPPTLRRHDWAATGSAAVAAAGRLADPTAQAHTQVLGQQPVRAHRVGLG